MKTFIRYKNKGYGLQLRVNHDDIQQNESLIPNFFVVGFYSAYKRYITKEVFYFANCKRTMSNKDNKNTDRIKNMASPPQTPISSIIPRSTSPEANRILEMLDKSSKSKSDSIEDNEKQQDSILSMDDTNIDESVSCDSISYGKANNINVMKTIETVQTWPLQDKINFVVYYDIVKID